MLTVAQRQILASIITTDSDACIGANGPTTASVRHVASFTDGLTDRQFDLLVSIAIAGALPRETLDAMAIDMVGTMDGPAFVESLRASPLASPAAPGTLAFEPGARRALLSVREFTDPFQHSHRSVAHWITEACPEGTTGSATLWIARAYLDPDGLVQDLYWNVLPEALTVADQDPVPMLELAQTMAYVGLQLLDHSSFQWETDRLIAASVVMRRMLLAPSEAVPIEPDPQPLSDLPLAEALVAYVEGHTSQLPPLSPATPRTL